MVEYVSEFPSLLRMNNKYSVFYMYMSILCVSVYLPVYPHLDRFHFLATVNSDTMNKAAQISLQVHAFGAIAGLHGSSILIF